MEMRNKIINIVRTSNDSDEHNLIVPVLHKIFTFFELLFFKLYSLFDAYIVVCQLYK